MSKASEIDVINNGDDEMMMMMMICVLVSKAGNHSGVLRTGPELRRKTSCFADQ